MEKSDQLHIPAAFLPRSLGPQSPYVRTSEKKTPTLIVDLDLISLHIGQSVPFRFEGVITVN
jgi:hypothetical protein